MKKIFAARGKFMLIIWPFELSKLCKPVLHDCLTLNFHVPIASIDANKLYKLGISMINSGR